MTFLKITYFTLNCIHSVEYIYRSIQNLKINILVIVTIHIYVINNRYIIS